MKCIGSNAFERTQKTDVKSGFPELDKITNGWSNGNLIIVASRPAMGKTAFGMSLLREIAVKNRIPTAFFSLEMSNQQAINRFQGTLSRVDTMRIIDYDNGNQNALDENEKNRLADAEKQIDIAPIYLDNTPALSLSELWQKSVRLISDFQIKLIIIDYLQLMSAQGLLFSNRTEEVTNIVRNLKTLAKTLNIPVIAFSQLNRGVESRESFDGIRPKLSDLRESQAIEQDADVVCFIHCPEYYGIYLDADGNDLHGLAEIIVAKNRNGKTGDLRLKFNGECASFSNLNE